MKRFLVNLTECVSDQVLTDLDAFGVKVVYSSQLLQGFVIVETDKTKETLENFFLIESAQEERTGTIFV